MAAKLAHSPEFLHVLADVEKKYGSICRQATGISDSRRISTGVFQIDRVLGGGLPLNRVTLICGQKASFKTTMALKVVKHFFERCGRCLILREQCECPGGPLSSYCVYIDVEHALDEAYLERLQVDPSRFYILRPPHGEAACEYAEKFAKADEVGVVVVDSLAALGSSSELEAGYFDSQTRAQRAKLIARLFRALITHFDGSKPRLGIMLNHLMPNVNGRPGTYLPGGVEQRYLSSVMLQLWTMDKSKSRINLEDTPEDEAKLDAVGVDGEKARKSDVGFLVEHSKVSPENIAGEFYIYTRGDLSKGIRYGDTDDIEVLFSWCVRLGILKHESKKWKLRNGELTLDSQKAVHAHWREHPLEYMELRASVMEKARIS